MDVLNRLIELTCLQGALEQRCLLGGEWALAHPRASEGEAFYHVVLSGECTLRVQGHPDTLLVEGDVAMLPRGDAHLLTMLKGKPVDAGVGDMNTHFNGAVTVRTNISSGPPALDLLCGRFSYTLDALLISVLPDIVKMSFERSETRSLATLVAMMRKEASEPGPGAQSIVSSLSTALFTLLVRAHLALRPSTDDVFALLAHPRIGASVVEMLERPAEDWTIAMLANRSAMSRATYMRAFGAFTGDSPMSLLTRIRMQLGATLLSRTDKSVAIIAGDVGYRSESAFSKNFKAAFGVAPGLFRQTRS